MKAGPDIAGQRFGRLVATRPSETVKYAYECRCDCGTEKTIKKGSLVHGYTMSCGCALRDWQATNPKTAQLSGNKYGFLTVKDLIGKDKKRHAVWRCLCDCGKERSVTGTMLLTGKVISCGCQDKHKLYDPERTEQECTICGFTKPMHEFNRLNSKSVKHGKQCIECLSEHKGKAWLKWRYGITPEQLEEMKQKQENKCAICLMVCDRLCVDHCHTTGRVRGLLCGTCNSAIGMLGENETLLQRAIEYLKPPKLLS